MMRILITGSHSYTGNILAEHFAGIYDVSRISLKGSSWKSESFRGFDAVIHTAGIAHDSTKTSDKDLYYAVNSQLTFDAAMKAKSEGVKQFIFMSSSIVYGKSAPIGQEKIITRETPVNPESYYGASKVKAEELISQLDDENFHVCILRCPMIYGKNCRGNYPVLSKLARKLPIFPNVKNSRSMLYVKNFCEFVRLMIKNNERGVFWPQNSEYSHTSELVKMIAEVHGRKILLVPFCELPLRFLANFSGLVNKAFGSLTYDMSLSVYCENYALSSLHESIAETEK
ncbi:MAG: NAD-dependent epimerase/dehydratase family protein [Synergistaceae bacterium]|nr:NAD-dependent epimerase/dehydratase family protein [Synergistaceae bacterium]